jgi:hypothetical protein
VEGIETFLSQIVTLGLEWIWSVSWYWIPAGLTLMYERVNIYCAGLNSTARRAVEFKISF